MTARSTDDLYRAYLDGELSLTEASARLRALAQRGPVEVGSLDLDRLPPDQREKAHVLLDELIGPACRRCVAGDISVEAAIVEIAPFLLPHSVFALNVGLANGAGDAAMSRFAELIARIIEVSEGLRGQE